jgi:hypothetical protein
MKELRLTIYEIRRLFHLGRTWLFVAAFVIFPILLCTDRFGLGNSYSGTMSNVFMLMPAKQAAFVGVIAALLLTLLEMQRMTKYGMSAIVETATNPLRNQLRQTIAIITVAVVSLLSSLLFVLPYTAISMGSVFKLSPFLACWIFIYFGATLTTILLASGLFMISRRLDISFVIVGMLIGISYFSPYNGDFLFFWVQTNIYQLSDATDSLQQIDVILYGRLVWLLAAAAVHMLGLAGMRRYGKNLFQSLILSARKVALPTLAALLAVCCFLLIWYEPFFDTGPVLKSTRAVDPETGIVVYKTDESSFRIDTSQNERAFVASGEDDITVDTQKRIIRGEATYSIINTSGRPLDVPFAISPGLDFLEIFENGTRIKFEKNNRDNFMASVYHLHLTTDKKATLRIVYQGSPKSDWAFQRRQWGITKEFVLVPYVYPIPNNNWSFETDCTLYLPDTLTPIMENTLPIEVPSDKTGFHKYTYKVKGPIWLIAGDYTIEKLSLNEPHTSFIYLKGREKAMQDSNAAAIVTDVVNFFTQELGPLDFGDKPFIIAELDASFVSGGWGLGNMSVFGESMFVGTAYKGSPEAANIEGGSGIGVAVHEIAHQWWGWSPDSVYPVEDGQSPWGAEGLTVYCTYLYMKHRYGEEYAKRVFTDAWEKDTKRMQNAFYLTHLQYISKLPENDAAEIYSAFESITRYEMMPYLLLKAEKLVGGEEPFIALLRSIRQKYRHQELGYEAFLNELGLSKKDMRLD